MATERLTCLAQAVKLLATRTHFRAELARKLAARGYEEEEVAGALEELAARRYLDDEAAGREYLRGRLGRNYGAARLVAELGERGLPMATARALVAENLPEDELAQVQQAAARLAGKHPDAIARHLARRGFSSAVISAYLSGAGFAAEEE